MLKNYLKVAARTLWRDKSQTAINVVGLAIGFTCCVLIALFIRNELSYDDFHKHADRIVALGARGVDESNAEGSLATPFPLAAAVKSKLPFVTETVNVLWPGSGMVRRAGEAFVEEEGVYHVGPSFFDIFSFPIRRGDPDALLHEPNTAVVTPEFADRHFPNENPLGKTFESRRYGEHEYRVVGIVESRENSYFDFTAVLSLSTLPYGEMLADSWGSRMVLTFAELQPGATEAQFDERVGPLLDRHLGEDRQTTYFAQPLTGLYLSSLVPVDGFRGAWRYVYLFGTIALIILVLACINYANLMTARASRRAREVGVRRSVGAGKGQLAGQFLLESVLLTAGAFVLALGLSWGALPAFNTLFGTELAFGGTTASILLLLAAAAFGVGLLTGSYPALYLSAFQPTEVLRGSGKEGPAGAGLRKGLVVFQFGIAVVLLVCTGIVFQQLQFTQEKDLGFEGEQVVVMDAPQDVSEAFRDNVVAHSSVVSASVAEAVPGEFNLTLGHAAADVTPTPSVQHDRVIRFRPAAVDSGYVETLGLDVVAGRNFDPNRPSDATEGHLLNETAVRALGWTPEEAVGKTFDLDDDLDGTVIGVVQDFHTASLREPIQPVVIQIHPVEDASADKKVAIRLAAGSIGAGLDHLRETWGQFAEEAFRYSFLDESFAAMYETEQRLGRVFGLFAALAIFIACLGLLGLAAFSAERRRKEVAIRKVLGATARSVVTLLSTDFLKLVGLASVLASPVAYLLMRRWLHDFAYRIDIGPWIFVGAIASASIVALLTVSTQALRAAWTDPAAAIRQE